MTQPNDVVEQNTPINNSCPIDIQSRYKRRRMTRYANARITNPTRYFETPNTVLSDKKLSHDDKIKVLRSMALDADQSLQTTSESMAGTNLAYNANDLQSALIHLEDIEEAETFYNPIMQNGRFQRIMVVTTVDQDLNREIADVAYDMAEIAGGKVCLLNVVPSTFERAGLSAAGPTVIFPLTTVNDTQIIEGRNVQLTELMVESGSSVETEIEVRRGEVEQVIIEYADDCGADVIVVGSPNRSWLEALFETSIADSVTKFAPCPVLVVPAPA
ncbi:MAG: nucleotide-binding universal stress UspA family protein [Yoonia sp.]